jgi:hypothetical protein
MASSFACHTWQVVIVGQVKRLSCGQGAGCAYFGLLGYVRHLTTGLARHITYGAGVRGLLVPFETFTVGDCAMSVFSNAGFTSRQR